MERCIRRSDDMDSADVLLAQCRSELAEKLDDLAVGSSRRALAAVWLGAALDGAASGVGRRDAGFLRRPAGHGSDAVAAKRFPAANNGRAVNVLASQKLTDEQLSKMAVAGINLSPWPNAAPGTVQLQLRAEQPMVLSGNVDDSNMRRVLTYVVENGERFDAGMRLDCLDALKAQARDEQVRKARCGSGAQRPESRQCA